MERLSWKQDKMKDHYVKKWDGVTACGKDSLTLDLNQARDWDLVNCKNCLMIGSARNWIGDDNN